MYFAGSFCTALLNPSNGRVSYNRNQYYSGEYPIGTQATYSCKSGYIRDGPRVRTCSSTTGHWSVAGGTTRCGNEL